MELRHSRLGIAAFVLSLISLVATFIVVGIAGYLEVSTPGGLDENSPTAVVIGLAMIASLLGSFLALVIGIAALFEADRKKIFATLAIAIPIATFGAVVFLYYLGTMAE